MMNPNPPHDRALIGAKRKTSSSRTAVLNLGQSPRVYPVGAASKSRRSVGRDSCGIGCDDVYNNSGRGSDVDMHIANAGEEKQEPQQRSTREGVPHGCDFEPIDEPLLIPAPLAGEGVLVDPDIVAVMRCFEDDDLMDSVDFKFRTCLAFIPDAGIFTVQGKTSP
ncbi:hypothetical protein MHU86_24422 [Fragilaria crotonensis]|nr:hypothetical protein MHU86_24422 [Fragilaria crotonensis]